jgi:peptidoglycan-N-acetylglucosamine deacetylase
MFYWIKSPKWIKRLLYNLVWDIPNNNNKIYLTFDDGPIPEVTEFVLKVLKDNNIRATFFCIGHNIEKNPEIFKKIIADQHAIGNHTFNHLNGWQTSSKEYIENVLLCENSMGSIPCKLFRPPYGKIKSVQSNKIRDLGYKIIMWDVLSADFDTTISPEKCLENATKKVKTGSVIIFHDSMKAFHNLQYALPKTIKILKEKGFGFDIIQ